MRIASRLYSRPSTTATAPREIQEYMKHGEKTDAVFEQSYTWNNGMLHPGDTPGIGVELDVDEAGKYPYVKAYLPYNRLADGTVHDW